MSLKYFFGLTDTYDVLKYVMKRYDYAFIMCLTDTYDVLKFSTGLIVELAELV